MKSITIFQIWNSYHLQKIFLLIFIFLPVLAFSQNQPGSFAEGVGNGFQGWDTGVDTRQPIRGVVNQNNRPRSQAGSRTGGQADCQQVCGSRGIQCYTGSRMVASANQCVCGNNYCLKGPCDKLNWHFNPNASNPSERCSPNKPQQASTCPSDQVETAGYDDFGNEIPKCVCKDSKKAPVNGSCTAGAEDNTAELQAACTNAKGEFNASDKSCLCQGIPEYGKIAEGIDCSSNSATNISGLQRSCQQAGGTLRDRSTCICNNTNQPAAEVDDPNGGTNWSCTAQATTPAETDDAKFNRVLQECGFDRTEAQVNKCSEKASDAVEKCEKKAFESDKNAQQLGGVMQLVSRVQQNKAVEHADPDACGKAAYGATAAYWALDAFKTTCETEVQSCKDECNPFKKDQNNFNELRQNCERAYNAAFGAAQNPTGRVSLSAARMTARNNANKFSNGNVDDHETARELIRSYINEIETKAKDNLVKCESDAVAGEEDLAKYLSELLTTSMAAAQCKNAASTSAARCAALGTKINPDYCLANPAEPCCDVINGYIVNCNGKDFATKHCVCARTPDASVCKTTTVGTAPIVPNVGGPSAMTAPGGIKPGNQYKPVGTVGSGGFELNDTMDPNRPQNGGPSAGSANPFGVAGASGGGGGGGLPNSPSDGALPPAGEAEKPGLVGGAFNQLKTLADRVFGGGSGNSNSRNYGAGGGSKNPKKNGIDPNKWKPGLRGLASGGSPFGPRNKDIWKIMNAQYGVQNHTFLGVEGK